MRETEAADLNVEEFIAGCRDLHAEAIVFSAGGVYAFYDTRIPYHMKSPHMGNRDLLKEVIQEAHKYNIRVIARFDFEKARQDLFKDKPDWFYLDENNEPRANRSGNDERFYKTELLGGYQNEDFALPVLREIFTNYDVDGVHLNAPGFSGIYIRDGLIKKFDIPEDSKAQERWREERLAEQMFKYREIIHASNKDALFMAEINSPESPEWGSNRGFNHELLAGSYTNLLSTSGEASDLDLYRMRWWSSLAADWSHASNSPLSGLPLVNLKVAFVRGKYSMKPVNEYRFFCYQAIAHNAGIKAPTYGLINNMPDERTASMIADPFRFMERSENYLTSAVRIAPVALVWPEKEHPGVNPSDYNDEMLGLYRTLISEHVLFEIVLAHRLTEKMAGKYQTLILPSMSILNKAQSQFLQTYILNGGHVIILDALPELPFSPVWEKFLGGEWTRNSFQCAYGVSVPGSRAGLPSVITLNTDIRRIIPPREAEIWYTASPTPGGSFIPETYPDLERGNRPVLFHMDKGKGTITWFGSGLGSILWKNDFPDYGEILDRMLDASSGYERMVMTDAPGTVNLTAYKVNSNIVLHLVNGTGKIPLKEPVPVGPFKVVMQNTSLRKISFLEPGSETRDIKGQNAGGNHEITIDKLKAYGILVLTPE
jgi:hypothetical protein